MSRVPETLPLLVGLAVLGAAVLHASWNALTKSLDDQLVAFAGLDVASGLACLVLLPFVATPAASSLPYLGASIVIHVIYKVMLMQSYRLGDLGRVYPIARGTAPLLVGLLAVPFANEPLTTPELLGMAAVTGGIISLADFRAASSRHRMAVPFALATGACIAAYSLSDGLGARHSGAVLGYLAWLLVVESVPIPLYCAIWQRERLSGQWRATWRRAGPAGVLSVVAYGIVLWAQTRGPLGTVAALRETGVIVAALMGWVFLHERFGRREALSALAVAAGAALLVAH